MLARTLRLAPASSFRFTRPLQHRTTLALFSTSITRMSVIEERVANVQDLKDGEMKEFGLGEGRVLLSQVNGQIFATSHKCTHYGAPLATGVLSSEGPLGTVRASELPPVIIKDGGIYVKAEENALKAARRKPARKSLAKDEGKTVVILGGGASGTTTAENLREQGFAGRIIVVSRESYYPIDRPQLSKKVDIGDPASIQLRNVAFWEELGVEFLLSTVRRVAFCFCQLFFRHILTNSAQSVDTNAKTVTLSSGSQLSYDTLVLATGAYARTVPIPGIDLGNVFTLRTVDNANTIFQAVKASGSNPNVVIIGSSFIGMELASAFSKTLKTAEAEPAGTVTVVGREEVPFQRVLGKQIGEALMNLHTSQKVQFRMKAGVNAFTAGGDGKVSSVQLTSGEELPADVVILGTGVSPQTDYLKGNDAFKLQRDGSLKVDKHFNVEGHKDVYAVGDIARFHWELTGEDLRVEHWSHAENTGRFVAFNILGGNRSFDKVPYFWTAQQGKSIRYAGYASSFDDIIIQGSVETLSFAAFYVRGEKVVAVLSVGKDPVVSHASELLRINKHPSASELHQGKIM
ncbi:hypothetical protein BC937DRAFT_89651 [Endogone sp. FLAS-F59071]|nr:hypothetical protein BC937DRAFT_89651 [Endogone sp. FLAS-F59071]|eukprot:RUS22322.1 hypothetical protein BC937DRAFT_89651 [Endogone sp. FLAS-F59071]